MIQIRKKCRIIQTDPGVINKRVITIIEKLNPKRPNQNLQTQAPAVNRFKCFDKGWPLVLF